MVSGFMTIAKKLILYIFTMYHMEKDILLWKVELIKELEGNDNPIEFVNNSTCYDTIAR